MNAFFQSLRDYGRDAAASVDALTARGLGEGPVAQALADIALQDIAAGLDRRGLITGILLELADPTAVKQNAWKTCAAATVQLWLALRQPEEYARLVAGLASPPGRVPLAGGPWLERCRNSEQPDDSGRTASSRLLQAAFMEFANGPDSYSNRRDESDRPDGPSYSGLYPDQFDVLIEAVTARHWDTLEVGAGNSADAVALIQRATQKGEHVPVSLRRDKMMHRLLVRDSRSDFIHCLDPAGGRVKVALDDFRARLGFVSLPGGSASDGPSLFVTAGESEAWVRLKTLQPVVPDFCPGCGNAATALLEIPHAFGRLDVPACAACDGSSWGRLVSSLFVQSPKRGILAVRHASDAPPMLELTARHPKWLTQLWRLNRGSGRNYLEKW